MNKSRFETGMENLKKIDGDGGNAVIRSLENISPDLGTYIVEFAFGLSKEKIIETFLQCIPYTGFPKVLNAIFTADKLFQKLP